MVDSSTRSGSTTIQVGIVLAVILAVVVVAMGTANRSYITALFNPTPVFPTPPKPLLPRNVCKDIMLPMYVIEKPEFFTKRAKVQTGEIHCRIYADFPARRTVLFCHGNTGVVSDHAYMVDLTRLLSLNLVMFDYRGFGASTGCLSEESILEDADLVYRYVVNEIAPAGQLIVWGMSLGGAPASFLASQYSCAGVLLQSTFSSLSDIAIYSQIPDYLRAAATAYVSGSSRDLPNRLWLASAQSPVMLLHSEEDTKIPIENAQILLDACPTAERLVRIKGDHATPQLSDAQVKELSVFLTGYRTLTAAGAQEFERVLTYHENQMQQVAK